MGTLVRMMTAGLDATSCMHTERLDSTGSAPLHSTCCNQDLKDALFCCQHSYCRLSAFRCISQLIGGQILPDLFALLFGSDAFSAISKSVM